MNPANFPRRKRQKQDEAIERMTKNIEKLDSSVLANPEDVEARKEHRQHLVDAIENTKKRLR